jgi:hypothetical protein
VSSAQNTIGLSLSSPKTLKSLTLSFPLQKRESHNTHFQCFIKPLSFGEGVWGEAKNIKAKVLHQNTIKYTKNVWVCMFVVYFHNFIYGIMAFFN